MQTLVFLVIVPCSIRINGEFFRPPSHTSWRATKTSETQEFWNAETRSFAAERPGRFFLAEAARSGESANCSETNRRVVRLGNHKRQNRLESSTMVAIVFLSVSKSSGNEILYDVNKAIDLIEAYGNQRGRESHEYARRRGGGRRVAGLP